VRGLGSKMSSGRGAASCGRGRFFEDGGETGEVSLTDGAAL
jgi:hypothetical protein